MVSYKYTLPPRRIKLGPFLLWDMYVHQETKYSQMADLWFLSRESLFRSPISKYSMRSMVLTYTTALVSSTQRCIRISTLSHKKTTFYSSCIYHLSPYPYLSFHKTINIHHFHNTYGFILPFSKSFIF